MNFDFTTIDKLVTRKSMIILSVILLILVLSILLVQRAISPSQVNTSIYENPLYTEETNMFPTGIILPTDQIPPSEIDVIQIDPTDGKTNVAIRSPIVITFSQPIQNEQITFSIDPPVSFTEEYTDTQLVVTPQQDYQEGTLHTFRISFTEHPDKVRLYRFWTTGTFNQVLPDTREEQVIEEFQEKERELYPDIFVANNTPYENDYFIAQSFFEPQVPSRYYLLISPKNNNLEIVEAEVYVWLQVLGLTSDQIDNFDIRYERL